MTSEASQTTAPTASGGVRCTPTSDALVTGPAYPAPGGARRLLRVHPGMQIAVGSALGLLAVAGAYAVGVRRLARRGHRWPRSRSTWFALGILALAVATQPPLASHDTSSFPAHVTQHLLLAMGAPPLLALGAPMTLALQAARPATKAVLRRWLATRWARLASHSALTWPLFALSLWALYETPLFELSVRSPFVHEAVHLHFLVSGAAFLWPIVGADPMPHRPSPAARMALVALAIPLHAFVGLSLLARREPLYGQDLAGTHLGAGILWVAGELVATLVLGAVVVQWIRDDARVAAHEDRLLAAVAQPPGPSGVRCRRSQASSVRSRGSGAA